MAQQDVLEHEISTLTRHDSKRHHRQPQKSEHARQVLIHDRAKVLPTRQLPESSQLR